MAHFFRHLIACSLVALLASTGLTAQTSDPASNRVDLDFTVFGPRALRGLCYLPDGNPQNAKSLKFYNSYRSPTYSYHGEQPLKIYDQNALNAALAAVTKPGDPVTLPEPAAIVAIPVGLHSGFLLFIPKDQPRGTPRQYNVFVLDDSEASVPADHVVIINASRMEWPARVNGKDMVITRGIMRPIQVRDGRVTIFLTHSNPEYQSVLLSDQWPADKKQRSLVILFPPPAKNDLLPQLVRLIDQLPDTDDAKPAK